MSSKTSQSKVVGRAFSDLLINSALRLLKPANYYGRRELSTAEQSFYVGSMRLATKDQVLNNSALINFEDFSYQHSLFWTYAFFHVFSSFY